MPMLKTSFGGCGLQRSYAICPQIFPPLWQCLSGQIREQTFWAMGALQSISSHIHFLLLAIGDFHAVLKAEKHRVEVDALSDTKTTATSEAEPWTHAAPSVNHAHHTHLGFLGWTEGQFYRKPGLLELAGKSRRTLRWDSVRRIWG